MAHEARTDSLTVRYGRNPAVNDVSIIAPGGSVTAIVGPNGAGKSSILLAIYGSVQSSGRVVIDGNDVSAMRTSDRARAGVALVPQGRQLFPRLDVRENLQVMAEMLHLPKSAVDGALDRFAILRVRVRSLAGVLSGGEQQMLVVARALMADPRVLLLDETMTGLAPLIVQSISETVREFANEGVAVLIAEPSIGAVRGLIDRGYVLVRSRVVASDEGGGAALDRAYQAVIGVQQAEAHQAIEHVENVGTAPSSSDREQPRFPTPP
jgi:branched-chain amino acid transport system ATP-binding protein